MSILVGTCLVSACSGPAEVDETNADTSGSWKLVWADEFDGDTLDSEKWAHEHNCFGGGNNEQQCYTDRPENTQIVDGVLNLIAREESFNGPATWDIYPGYDRNDTSATRPYTSGRIVTRGKYGFTYGRIEMRARIPLGQGVWPAFWMLSDDDAYGGWPLSGEIDVMEGFNTGVESGRVTGATQYGMAWPNYIPMDTEYHPLESLLDGHHVYAVEWEADELRWFIDGNHYMTQRSDAWYTYIWGGQDTGFHVPTPRAPFDQPFHIILNLAIGGNAVGPADTDWPEDRRFEIDYVRVYECDSGNADGTGCAGSMDAVNPDVATMPDDGGPTLSRYSLYDDGPAALALSINNAPVENALSLQQAGKVTVSQTNSGDRGAVIQALFEDAGSLSLASGDMSATEGLTDAVELQGRFPWTNLGEILFDLYVNSIGDDTELKVGISGTDGEAVLIAAPESGQWTRVAVRLLDFIQPDSLNLSYLDLTTIDKLFVLESTGPADILVDNVSISCAVTSANIQWLPEQSCSIKPAVGAIKVESPAILFDDKSGPWPPNAINAGVSFEIVADAETDRGNVFAVKFDGNGTLVGFMKSDIPSDFSAFAGGTLEFDLLIESEPDDTQWTLVVDCGYPCGTSNVPLSDSVEGEAPVIGEWQHYTFRVDDLVSRDGSTLDLERVFLALAVLPSWNKQAGAAYQLDNVVYTAPE